MRNPLGASWRTASMGVALIVLALAKFAVALLDGNLATHITPSELVQQLIAGGALLLTRDNKTTGAQARAAKEPPTPQNP